MMFFPLPLVAVLLESALLVAIVVVRVIAASLLFLLALRSTFKGVPTMTTMSYFPLT